MKRIFISDNYIIVEEAGSPIKTFPIHRSDYEESRDAFFIRKSTSKLVHEIPFNEAVLWENELGVFYTEITLREFLRKNTADFNTASGGSGAIPITQSVDGWSNFAPGTESGQLAYSTVSEGISWLPGTIGGTYYPEGFYLWNGTTWVSDRNAIAEQFDKILNNSTIVVTSDYELPDSSTVIMDFTVKNNSSNNVNITTLPSDKIEGDDSFLLYPSESITLHKGSANNYLII